MSTLSLSAGGFYFYRIQTRKRRTRFGTDLAMAVSGLNARRTQHMPLSAASVQTTYRHRQVGPKTRAPFPEFSFCVCGVVYAVEMKPACPDLKPYTVQYNDAFTTTHQRLYTDYCILYKA